MDLVIVVILCNCTISIGCLAIAGWTMRFRRQIIVLENWCDRWSSDCDWLSELPASLTASKGQLDRLQQLYQQQLVTIDRIRTIGLAIGIARSLALRRK